MKKYLLIGLFLLGLFIYPIKVISGNTSEELYESLQNGWLPVGIPGIPVVC